MLKFLYIAFIMTAIIGTANAADSGTPLRGGVCLIRTQTRDGTVLWNCEHIGRVEIRQIYEKGFRVVGAFLDDPAEKISKLQYLIIEEQRK